MADESKQLDNLIWFLSERAKELNCLYKVDEILNQQEILLSDACYAIVAAIPDGWQHPEICNAEIIIEDQLYQLPGFMRTPWGHTADIIVHDRSIGKLGVYYTVEKEPADFGPFLKEEARLIHAIADRLGHFIMHKRMKQMFNDWQSVKTNLSDHRRPEWRGVIDMLRQTDQNLFLSISHKLLNHLCWTGIEDAKKLARYYSSDPRGEEDEIMKDSNVPHRMRMLTFSNDFLADETFKIASDHMTDSEILMFIQKRIQEDKQRFLVRALNRNLALSEVADAIRRYHRIAPEGTDEQSSTQMGVNAALIRRFFSEQVQFVDVAKRYVTVGDFYELLPRVVFSAESSGKLGGKSAGLYVAEKIIKRSAQNLPLLADIKTPKTWYMTSDALLSFMYYNNLEEIVEQKYKELDQIRLEYPHVVQTFKNSLFPPEILKGLSMALDDLNNVPIIVRSSSLLEDRMGAAFSGKYKSLFLANQGNKEQRLAALTDAIAEVYASTFGPDPIGYRAERGLLDFYEEMGIMIQEVVGRQIGDYYLPMFAGVAFSNNEFRWSPRIKREDGLIRIVPGLGTRAVDRVSDDYPVLITPGQPGLRVNVSIEEQIRYSPKFVDVINLNTHSFETIEVEELLKSCAYEIPNLTDIISVIDDGHKKPIPFMGVDFTRNTTFVTFEGLITQTTFVQKMKAILKLLQETLGTPVDIEFASDGTDFYLLQCRPQTNAEIGQSAPIPKDIIPEKMIFSANRYVSNGRVPDITHIVYVDPEKYNEVSDRQDLLAVGHAVSKLNQLLPKRQFILMGPGRWGSRGDIKLGVSVTYSDVNNTSCLIEIAKKKGNYVPDLSFGTHFFQDLVEAKIRYLPLYPDDPGIVFNEQFFTSSRNVLSELIPEFEHLQDVIKVIDVSLSSNGQILQVLMNAEQDEAVGILAPPKSQPQTTNIVRVSTPEETESPWRWRLRVAETIASYIDPQQFGVKGFYLFGSTKNATAGPASDIDILIHFDGSPEQQQALLMWLDGWSLSLSEQNYFRTGVRTNRLLDVHIVTDDDITNKTSFASKIDAITDAARQIPIGKRK
jgi:pyruvate, water dikinase